jgi:hypothetical protein
MHLQYKPDASTKVQVEENLYSVAKTVWEAVLGCPVAALVSDHPPLHRVYIE